MKQQAKQMEQQAQFMLGLHDEQLVEQLGCPVGLINCSPKNCQKCRHNRAIFVVPPLFRFEIVKKSSKKLGSELCKCKLAAQL